MRTFAAALLALIAGQAHAQQAPGSLADPWLPPSLAKEAAGVPRLSPSGAALRSQVEARLRAPFDAAARGGRLTREQAAAAGLGFIARHFDAIDRRREGAIAFEDYKRFLKERGAALD